MSNYQQHKKSELERIIRTQAEIRDKVIMNQNQKNRLNDYIIDLQNYYFDKYKKYYYFNNKKVL